MCWIEVFTHYCYSSYCFDAYFTLMMIYCHSVFISYERWLLYHLTITTFVSLLFTSSYWYTRYHRSITTFAAALHLLLYFLTYHSFLRCLISIYVYDADVCFVILLSSSDQWFYLVYHSQVLYLFHVFYFSLLMSFTIKNIPFHHSKHYFAYFFKIVILNTI